MPVGLPNAFTLIEPTMRLATLALLTTLSAAVYAAPRAEHVQGIRQDKCIPAGISCAYEVPESICCGTLVCVPTNFNNNNQGVRYQLPDIFSASR